MNYIITLNDGRIFGGWDPVDGHMVILPSDRRSLAYRMQRTVAMRTIDKVQDFASVGCRVERITS